MSDSHTVHEFEVDPTANVGFVVFAWEKVEFTIEAAILELAGCPDYRARAFTTYMSFPSMWKAVRVLLKETDDFDSIKDDLKSLGYRIEKYRQLRNALVHANWTGFYVNSENPGISAEDYSARNALTMKKLVFEHDKIREIGNDIWVLHEHLTKFFTDSCGLDPSGDKYQLPLLKT